MEYNKLQSNYNAVDSEVFYFKKQFPVQRNMTVQKCTIINGLRREKTCLRGFANNKRTDQPAHSRRLISAFVIRVLESIISQLATSEVLIF